MRYSDGQKVQVGDRVALGADSGGVVVCSVDDDIYTTEHPREQWAYLQRGVMIEFPSCGLIHYETGARPQAPLQGAGELVRFRPVADVANLRTLRQALRMTDAVQGQADAWIEMTRLDLTQCPSELFDEGFQLNLEAQDRPDFAWDVICEIVSRFADEDLAGDEDTDPKHLLSNLGAGPLEDLLAHHGPDYIERVELAARRSPAFRWTVACVWKNSMTDEVWRRVQLAGGKRNL